MSGYWLTANVWLRGDGAAAAVGYAEAERGLVTRQRPVEEPFAAETREEYVI